MPQMMPIWWSILLILTLLFFVCMNVVLYYLPLVNLNSFSSSLLGLEKKINMSEYDL